MLLTYYNPKLSVIVAADAWNYGMGAVLTHIFPNGSEEAVPQVSRTLTEPEIEKDALAINYAVKKFHKYIYGCCFTLLTDHKPLLSIFSSKRGIPTYSANCLQRWATILAGYNFEIKYWKTTDFGQADGLSRLIANHQTPMEESVTTNIATEKDIRSILAGSIRNIPVTADKIRHESAKDVVIRKAMN